MKLKARGLTDEEPSLHYRWGITLAEGNVEIINAISKKFIQCLLGYILDQVQHIRIARTKILTADNSQTMPDTMLSKNSVLLFPCKDVKMKFYGHLIFAY
jgi:hypothetical protein